VEEESRTISCMNCRLRDKCPFAMKSMMLPTGYADTNTIRSFLRKIGRELRRSEDPVDAMYRVCEENQIRDER